MLQQLATYILLITSLSLFSQTNFHHTYGGSGKDIAYSSCETQDNGMMILGLTTSFGTGKDLYLMKLNHEGGILWSRTYGGKKVDAGIKIKPTSDGNFIIIGNTTSFGAKRRDLYLLKIDSEGNEIWSHTYGGELNEFGLDVAEAKNGGYILVGETNSFGVADHDIYVVKVDEKGNQEWSKTIGGDSLEFASSVISLDDSYVIGGETNSLGAGGYDAVLVKINLDGIVMWSKVYGGQKDEHLNALIEDDYGHLVFVGSSTTYGFGGRDLFYVLTDQEGYAVKVKSLGSVADEEPQVVRKVGNDGYIILGFSNSFNDQLTGQDAYIIRMNKRFKMRWSKTFGGDLNDMGFGLVTHTKGNFVVVGGSSSFSDREDNDIFAISIDDSRKIETCELTNVQTVRIPIHKLVTINNVFLEEIDVESDQIDAHTVMQEIESHFLMICNEDKLLIESNVVEEEE